MSELADLRPQPWRNPLFARRVPELDGLRGLAILLVVIWHYVAITLAPATPGLMALARRPLLIAWSGVDLFFVLSGFLIGGVLIDSSRSARYFVPFYARRFHRILPLYALFLVAFFAGIAGVPAIAGVDAGIAGVDASGPRADAFRRLFNLELPAWSYPLFVQNLFMSSRQTFGGDFAGVTWSLAIEEQFYLLLPLAVRKLSRKTLVGLVVAAVVAAPLLRSAISNSNPFFGPYTLLPCRADALGLGVLAAIASRHESTWAWLTNHRRALLIAFAVLLAGVVFLSGHHQGRLMNAVGYSWMAAFYATVLLLAIVLPGRFVRGLLGSKPLQELGMIAYGVYLIHMGANALLHAVFFRRAPKLEDWASVGMTVLAAGVSFGLAKLSWSYLEKPMVKRGHLRFPY